MVMEQAHKEKAPAPAKAWGLAVREKQKAALEEAAVEKVVARAKEKAKVGARDKARDKDKDKDKVTLRISELPSK